MSVYEKNLSDSLSYYEPHQPRRDPASLATLATIALESIPSVWSTHALWRIKPSSTVQYAYMSVLCPQTKPGKIFTPWTSKRPLEGLDTLENLDGGT